MCDINNSFPASHTPVRQVRMGEGEKLEEVGFLIGCPSIVVNTWMLIVVMNYLSGVY